MSTNSISWFDASGYATLSNLKGEGGNRFGAWTPDVDPVGPSVVGLGTGRTHRYEFREDDLISFEIAAIPGSELALMKRLKLHLMRDGEVLLTTDRPLAATYATCCIAPDTVPSIDFSDRQNLEYSFSAVYKSLVNSSGGVDPSSPFYPAFVPNVRFWAHGGILTPTKVEGDFVGGWYDSSGFGNDAVQATESKQPRYYENVANGHPVVRCDNVDDYLLTPEIMIPTLSPGSMLFWVARRTGSFAAHKHFMSFQTTAEGNGGSDESAIMENTSGNVEWYLGAQPGGTYDTIGSGSAASFNVHALKFTSTTVVTPYLNGVAGTPFDIYDQIESLGRNRLRIGAPATFGAVIEHAEIIWVYGLPATEYIDGLHEYLQIKYATP